MAAKKPYVLPSYAAFEAYLDSRRWESDTEGFIHEYCEYSKKQKSLGSEEFRLAAGRLLARALGYFDELRAAGKEIPADIKTGGPCERLKAAPKPAPKPVPKPVASRKKSKSPPSSSEVSPETLAVIAAAEEAEAAEKASAKKVAPPPSAPPPPAKKTAAPPPPSAPPPPAKKTVAPPPPSAPPPPAKKTAPPPPPSAKKTAPPVPPAAPAAPPAPPPAPLGPLPRAGATIPPVPEITPASCGQLTPEFIELWVADNYSHLPRGDPYGIKQVAIHPAFNRDYEIKRTVGDGTCLLHSFLTDLSPTYRSLTEPAKEVVGAAFRKHIYAMLFPPDERMQIQEDDFDNWGDTETIDAQVIEREENEYVNEAFEDDLYDALARAYIRDTNGYLYDDDIEKLRTCFKVRIIIVTRNDVLHDIFRLGPNSPEELAAEFAEQTAANYTRYIMIYQSGVHFEAVRRRGTEQYLFLYPEVREILEASRGTVTATRERLIALFAPGTTVVVRVDSGRVRRLVVAPGGVYFAREFSGPVAPVEQVYLEPANHAEPPQLYSIKKILSVNGAGFRLSDYQPVERPPSPEGVPGSPASTSATPELVSYNEQFPPLTLQNSTKRKPKTASAKHITPRRKSKSPSPPVLAAAPNNSNNEAATAKKGK